VAVHHNDNMVEVRNKKLRSLRFCICRKKKSSYDLDSLCLRPSVRYNGQPVIKKAGGLC
jgi:hypothetical protein